MACEDNYSLPDWAMWTLFGMTLAMIFLLAVSLVESIVKNSAKLVKLIAVLLMLADLLVLLWVWFNSKLYQGGECHAQTYQVVIVAVLGSSMLALNQLSYWLLASSYYQLSY